MGRSHRSKPGKARLAAAIDKTRAILGVPDDYRIGIVPASDTGAYEMAMWTMLGARGLDILGWESFGKGWITDAVKQLKLDDIRVMEADYGALPDLGEVAFTRDVAFTWNGTTSGVRAKWRLIADDREGLTLCDATSAAFAMDLPWDKLDVTTYSGKSAGRRGRPRHAYSFPARRGAAGKLYAKLATAENLPPDQIGCAD